LQNAKKKGGIILREYLKELRKNKNLTQMDVASRLDMSESYYNLIENGSRQTTLRIDVAQGLAEALDIPLSKLLELENKKDEVGDAKLSKRT